MIGISRGKEELCGRETGEHVIEHGLEGLRDAEEADGCVGCRRGDGESAIGLGVESVESAGCENWGVRSAYGEEWLVTCPAVMGGSRNGILGMRDPGG